MSFLTPLFLVGLAGLAIPVLLHLIQKERRNVVQFPSLMFIRRIPYQSVQRRRIRHWLLLALRLAALALLVMAFGRPFFRRADVAAAGGTGAPPGLLHGHDLDRVEIACDRPLPLQADGEDLGDVEHVVIEAERDAVGVLV